MGRAFAFVGPSGSGKTTLICRLLEEFGARRVHCAAVKHAHHGFEMDYPGKDSYKMRLAGAAAVVVASASASALWRREKDGRRVEQLIDEFLGEYDIVLVEGYHWSSLPKILLPGAEAAGYAIAPPVRARISVEGDPPPSSGVPHFRRDDVALLAEYLLSLSP